jgi:hypothetical protein
VLNANVGEHFLGVFYDNILSLLAWCEMVCSYDEKDGSKDQE